MLSPGYNTIDDIGLGAHSKIVRNRSAIWNSCLQAEKSAPNTWWLGMRWNINMKKLDIVSISLLILLHIELFACEVGACLGQNVKFFFNVMQFTLFLICFFFFYFVLGDDRSSSTFLFPEFES